MPASGRVVPEFGRPDVREVFVRTYRVVYKITRGAILVLVVFDGSMQMPSDVDPDEPEA
jgi:toxin ParE1/3/4